MLIKMTGFLRGRLPVFVVDEIKKTNPAQYVLPTSVAFPGFPQTMHFPSVAAT
jgi:hypothetical protein